MATLLLQGPLGPFFSELATRLEHEGLDVHKISFNGGDVFYAPSKCHHQYDGSLAGWSSYLTEFIVQNHVHQVFVYGDCRAYHRVAKDVCNALGIRYFAFEEGYLRPNYITLEEEGVNGHSPIRYSDILSYQPIHIVRNEVPIGSNFSNRIVYASLYYIAGLLGRAKFKHYQHHRSFNPFYEAYCWVRSGIRKLGNRVIEMGKLKRIKQQSFFFVPLQVHNDAQIQFHSPYYRIEDFIEEVMHSYSKSGVRDHLIFKHHPMDRGHTHYRRFIQQVAERLGIAERVEYVHDLHVPTLLRYCKGVVTINSTTALQAFYHSAPVKVMGDAFFDKPRLTDHQHLERFWHQPVPVDMEFADRFRAYLLDHGQINGSFYSCSELTLNHLMEHLTKLGVLNEGCRKADKAA